MKNILIRACLVAFAMVGAMSAASAQDSFTLDGHAQFGANQTVDLLNARIVDMTPGAQKVTDARGVVHLGQFVNDTAFVNSDFQRRYARRTYTETYIWYNVSAMTRSRCVGNQTVIDWATGGTSTYDDACTRFTAINDRSRR